MPGQWCSENAMARSERVRSGAVGPPRNQRCRSGFRVPWPIGCALLILAGCGEDPARQAGTLDLQTRPPAQQSGALPTPRKGSRPQRPAMGRGTIDFPPR